MQDRTIPDSDISVSSSWSDSTAARHSRYMTLGVTSRELFYVPFYALPAPPFEKAQATESDAMVSWGRGRVGELAMLFCAEPS